MFVESLKMHIKRDHAFLVLVLSSILLGKLSSKIRNVYVKKITMAVFGFLQVLIFCGFETYHSFVSIVVGALIIKLYTGKHMPRLMFAFSFLYRIFFCNSGFLGFSRDENNLANGIQLVLTIKLISVAYEVYEFRNNKPSESSETPTACKENSSGNLPCNGNANQITDETRTQISNPDGMETSSGTITCNGHQNQIDQQHQSQCLGTQNKSSQNCNGSSSKTENTTKKLQRKTMSLDQEPSFLDIVCYMYCFLGIATGPFFRYRTYHDMITMPHYISASIPVKEFITSRLYGFSILILASLCGTKYFNVSEMRTEEFYRDHSFLYRFLYVIPTGLIGLARYGLTWGLAECGFAAAGLGAYPAKMKATTGNGPTEFDGDSFWPREGETMEYDFETVRNINCEKGWFVHTYAKTFRYWNCSVQWWLAHFIYASPIFPKKLVFLKWIAVATVSAVWHGFKAGYYFSFAALPFIAMAEFLTLHHIGTRLGKNSKKIFEVVAWFLFKIIGINSFMTTFALSSYDDNVRYLSSVYFGIYTVSAVAVALSGLLFVHDLIVSRINSGKQKVD